MGSLEVLRELLIYCCQQSEQAKTNEDFADKHGCVKIASHYRVAAHCYDDIKKVLMFLGEEHNLEVRIGDD